MARYDYNPRYGHENYSFLLPMEKDFDPESSTIFMKEHFPKTFLMSGLYLASVFGGQKYMSTRKAFQPNRALFIWNLALAIFSTVGFIRVMPEFWWSIFGNSFTYSVCVSSYTVAVSGFWGDKFVLSKVLEFIDTGFLVVRKRKLIFLHYYHHVTVLIYSWYCYQEHTGVARWFVVMNYGAHSIMYSYYALTAIKIRPPKMISMLITFIQIFQMVMGCAVLIHAYHVKSSGGDCQQTYKNIALGLGMYSSFFFLFCNFFYQTYIKKDRSSKKTESKVTAETEKMKVGEATAEGVTKRQKRRAERVD